MAAIRGALGVSLARLVEAARGATGEAYGGRRGTSHEVNGAGIGFTTSSLVALEIRRTSGHYYSMVSTI